jgi:hypothetical protein
LNLHANRRCAAESSVHSTDRRAATVPPAGVPSAIDYLSALLAHPRGNATGVAVIIPPLILAEADEVIE